MNQKMLKFFFMILLISYKKGCFHLIILIDKLTGPKMIFFSDVKLYFTDGVFMVSTLSTELNIWHVENGYT